MTRSVPENTHTPLGQPSRPLGFPLKPWHLRRCASNPGTSGRSFLDPFDWTQTMVGWSTTIGTHDHCSGYTLCSRSFTRVWAGVYAQASTEITSSGPHPCSCQPRRARNSDFFSAQDVANKTSHTPAHGTRRNTLPLADI